jgi:hypothetical protein
MTILNIFVPKAQHTYVYDTEKLPVQSIEYLLDNGAKQALADKTAQLVRKDFTGTDEEFRTEARKLSDERDTQIRTGQVPGLKTPVDPMVALASTMGITVDQLKNMIELGASALNKVPAKRVA